MIQNIGYALCGMGKLVKGEVLPALKKTNNSQPRALIVPKSQIPEAREIAGEYGIKEKNIYDIKNYSDIANNPKIDVVYIATPNKYHCEHTVTAFKAGKHVLCEKPMAMNQAECRDMIKAAKAANCKLMIGYRSQFHPFYHFAKEVISEGKLGKVNLIDSSFAGNNAIQEDPLQWRFNQDIAGFGPIGDLGLYSLNITRYLLGSEPLKVSARASHDSRLKGMEAQMLFDMCFPDNILARGFTSYTASPHSYLKIHGDCGILTVNNAFWYGGLQLSVQGSASSELGPQIKEVEQISENVNQFADELKHMSECILQDKYPQTPGEEGLKDIRIIEALYESIKTGNIVKVS